MFSQALSEKIKDQSSALVISFPEGGGGWRADVGTLLIVHFKVLVFPHRWGIFF